jgi:uncharacterized protein (DUF433 family)/DNA-binding transcriptional MerR regulator
MEKLRPNFGKGIYTATDASNILNISYPKISYWFRRHVKDNFERESGFRYYYDYEDITAVSFHTLIELYVFNFFRENGVSTKKILRAHSELAGIFDNRFPFSLEDVLLLSGKDIIIKIEDIIAVSGTGFQQAIKEYILPYSRKIEFANNMAEKYYPLGKDHSIEVNPKNQFGSPIISGTNIRVNTITGLIKGGEDPSRIALLYDISEEQVQDAIVFAKAA